MKIYFVSNNKYKINETNKLMKELGVNIEGVSLKINEIQSRDIQLIAKDKALKAFKQIKRPLFVEQTGLYMEDFGNLPGGLTQIVWDSLEADKFCDYFGKRANTKAKAVTTIAYCDGIKIHFFQGQIQGKIVDKPRGDRSFQWDCVFQPDKYNETFAEMGEKKNEISMRRIAMKEFAEYLEKSI